MDAGPRAGDLFHGGRSGIVVSFAQRFPLLYHVTDRAALPLIRAHGLLPAKALCCLFEVPVRDRPALLTRNRDDYRLLRHPVHGFAALRRQGMRDRVLRSRLDPAIGPGEWRRFINGLVFFSVTAEAAGRFRAAEAGRDQVVLTWPTAELLAAGVGVLGCRYNNGYTDRSPPARRRLRMRGDYAPVAAIDDRAPVTEAAIPGGLPRGLTRALHVLT